MTVILVRRESSPAEVQAELHAHVEELLSSPPRRVLDAGCGRHVWLEVPDDAHVVGLDISVEELSRNQRLDEAIVGDVRNYPLPAASFDVAVCWWVLEHLRDPESAVANLSRSVRPGGAVVLAVPNFWSAKGLVTKFTPHRFHVWVYRRLFRKEPGVDGGGPFKTFMRATIAPRRLVELAAQHDLRLVYGVLYPNESRDWLPSPLSTLWRVALGLGRVATLGRWGPDLDEALLLFEKT